MKKKTVEEFLKDRLLFDKNGNCLSKFDEIAAICKMYAREKCNDQILHTINMMEFKFDEFNEMSGVDVESIINAKVRIV